MSLRIWARRRDGHRRCIDGIGLLPSTYCDEQIESGELIRLLPGWSSPEIFVHAVYPTRRFMPSKLQVFLQALKAWKGPAWIPLR